MSKDKKNFDAAFGWGRAAYAAQDYENSVRGFERALKLSKKEQKPRLHYYLGLAQAKQGDPKKATKELERAVKMDKSLVLAITELANVYMDSDRFADAQVRLQEALALDQKCATTHAAMGRCLAEQGIAMGMDPDAQNDLFQQAREYLKVAVQLNKKLATPYYIYARIVEVEGKRDKAKQYYKKAMELDPELARAQQMESLHG